MPIYPYNLLFNLIELDALQCTNTVKALCGNGFILCTNQKTDALFNAQMHCLTAIKNRELIAVSDDWWKQ